MINQYWQHKTSDEVFAVQVNIGRVFSACGPLHHTEIIARYLNPWNFNDEPETAVRIDESQDEFTPLEPPYSGDTSQLPRRRRGVRPRSEHEIANAKQLSHKGGMLRAFYYNVEERMLRFDGYDHEREIVRAFLQSDGGDEAMRELQKKLHFTNTDTQDDYQVGDAE